MSQTPDVLEVHAAPHLSEEGNTLASNHPQLHGHLFATSGTTSSPKWILHPDDSLNWNAETFNQHFEVTTNDHALLSLPTFHVGGFMVIRRARLANHPVTRFQEKWNPLSFHSLLTNSNATLTSLVPTQVHDLVSANLTPPPSLRLALIGGAQIQHSTYEKARSLGWPLVLSYGMTETAGLIAASSFTSPQLKILPGWHARTNSRDRLFLSGPGLFSGQLTADGFQPRSEPFPTSDRAHLSNNHLNLLGRTDDQIKILGELVDLTQLRSSLAETFPDTTTTLVATSCPRRGHQLTPVFEGSSSPALRERISNWNKTLPPFCRCNPPLFLEKLARTPLGKVDIQTLVRKIKNELD